MNPKISIIVPVYKVENYLHECIDSILRQTLIDFELILIDDGSPDNSGNICDDYSQKDERVKVIHKKNGGPSSSRNLGIKVAIGEYIGFVDSDDAIEKDMYEKMYKIGVKYNAEIVSCGYIEINYLTGLTRKFINPLNDKIIVKGKEIKDNLEYLLLENKVLGYASMCNKIYKREYIEDKKLLINENIKIAEDLCFNITAISKAQNICAVKEALYRYRRINKESIMNKKDDVFYLHLDARKEILNTLKINTINEDVIFKCVQYENFRTVADYLFQIKMIIASNKLFINKYRNIKELVHEQYFLNAFYNFNGSFFKKKTKIFIIVIKSILFLEKLRIDISLLKREKHFKKRS